MNGQLDSAGISLNELLPEKWVHNYKAYLLIFAKTKIDCFDICEDLVHDTFVSAFEQRHKFRGDCCEKTWLTAILKYKILNYSRHSLKNIPLIKSLDAVTEFQIRNKDEVLSDFNADVIEINESFEIIKQCIQQLPPVWNEVFTRKFIDSQSAREICYELNLSKENFWVILHRGRIKLKKALQEIYN